MATGHVRHIRSSEVQQKREGRNHFGATKFYVDQHRFLSWENIRLLIVINHHLSFPTTQPRTHQLTTPSSKAKPFLEGTRETHFVAPCARSAWETSPRKVGLEMHSRDRPFSTRETHWPDAHAMVHASNTSANTASLDDCAAPTERRSIRMEEMS